MKTITRFFLALFVVTGSLAAASQDLVPWWKINSPSDVVLLDSINGPGGTWQLTGFDDYAMLWVDPGAGSTQNLAYWQLDGDGAWVGGTTIATDLSTMWEVKGFSNDVILMRDSGSGGTNGLVVLWEVGTAGFLSGGAISVTLPANWQLVDFSYPYVLLQDTNDNSLGVWKIGKNGSSEWVVLGGNTFATLDPATFTYKAQSYNNIVFKGAADDIHYAWRFNESTMTFDGSGAQTLGSLTSGYDVQDFDGSYVYALGGDQVLLWEVSPTDNAFVAAHDLGAIPTNSTYVAAADDRIAFVRPNPAVISGTVEDDTVAAVGVVVELYRDQGAGFVLDATTITDSNGDFSFTTAHGSTIDEYQVKVLGGNSGL